MLCGRVTASPVLVVWEEVPEEVGIQRVSVDSVKVLEILVVTPVEALEEVRAVLVEVQVEETVDSVIRVIAREEALGVVTQVKPAVEAAVVEMTREVALVWKAHRLALGGTEVEEDFGMVSLPLIHGQRFRKR